MNINELILNFENPSKKATKKIIENTETNISYEDISNFINKYPKFSKIIATNMHTNEIIKVMINPLPEELSALSQKTIDKSLKYNYNLTNSDYQELFKFISLEEYCKKTFGVKYTTLFIEQLKKLPPDYIYNSDMPIKIILEEDIFLTISQVGLENINEFNRECENCFANNNYNLLRILSEKSKSINVNRLSQTNPINIKINPPISKEQLYELMQKIVFCGIYNNKLNSVFKNINGKFRNENQDLFLELNCPEDLQKLFYEKSLTPEYINEHKEYIPYLENKNLAAVFKPLYITINGAKINIYSYLMSKLGTKTALNFISNYSHILTSTLTNINTYTHIWKENYEPRLHDIILKDDNFTSFIESLIQTYKNRVIELGIKYKMEPSLFMQYQDLYLPEDSPQELKEALYNRKITSEFLNSHPEHLPYLKNINPKLLIKYISKQTPYGKTDLITILSKILNKEETLKFIITYGNYIEKYISKIPLSEDLTKQQLYDKVDAELKDLITYNKITCDKYIQPTMQRKYQTMFLPQNAPIELQQKFQARTLTIEDFVQNKDYLSYFTNTNILLSMPTENIWLLPLFDENNLEKSNHIIIKILLIQQKLNDKSLKVVFNNYIVTNKEKLTTAHLNEIVETLNQLSSSSLKEIKTISLPLARNIITMPNPLKSFQEIENIFKLNTLPTVGKVYSIFNILHPDFKDYSFSETEKNPNQVFSPVLKSQNNKERKKTILTDLIKSSLGSNNESLKEYINTINDADKVYETAKLHGIDYKKLKIEEQEVLKRYYDYIITLYYSISEDREKIFKQTGSPVKDIEKLETLFLINKESNVPLKDKIISTLCSGLGINTLEQAQNYITEKISKADKRGREYAENKKFNIEKGDFIKAVNIDYFEKLLENGINANDFLAELSKTDATPLDTDLSRVHTLKPTINETIDQKNKDAGFFGDAYIILKNNPNKIAVTKSTILDVDTAIPFDKTQGKLEAFQNGPIKETTTAYGIRTGFSSSDIDYIIFDEKNPHLDKLIDPISKCGFYIPIISKQTGKLIFTPETYDSAKEQTDLSHRKK